MLFVGEFPHRASEGCPAGCVLRPKGMQRTGCGRQSDVYLLDELTASQRLS